MKHKILVGGAITVAVLVVLAVFLRTTNTLQFYRIQVTSNAPTYYPGDHFFATNTREPARMDFITFRISYPDVGPTIAVFRLIGLPGDVVAIKDGNVRVNGINLDNDLNLMRHYRISNQHRTVEVTELEEEINLADNGFATGPDSTDYMFPENAISERLINARQIILPPGEADEDIRKRWHKPWNLDQFGPLRIPPGQYFVLGDHRYGANDSRYAGLIPEKDVVGVVLGEN
jgi:signal peptidase I